MAGWYSLRATEVIDQLSSRLSGLSEAEARGRLIKQGSNTLPEKPPPSVISFFIRQFFDVFIIVLLLASIIALLIGEWMNATAIISILLLNAFVGFLQEYKAQRTLQALKAGQQRKARVIRSGELREVGIEELVMGDIIHIEAGDRIPADARIISQVACRVDESLLTGESIPIEKTAQAGSHTNLPLSQQVTMLFRDTLCMAGKATALVVATGRETQVGMIALLLEEHEEQATPLQEKLTGLARVVGAIVLVMAILLLNLLFFQGVPFFDAVLTAVALAVAAIPEGLPAIITVVLSLGVIALARKNTIVRRLRAVETLGAVKYLLTDKTGTLTSNAIAVTRVQLGTSMYVFTGHGYEPRGNVTREDGHEVSRKEKEELMHLFEAAALCTSADLERTNAHHRVIGDTTEGALLVAGYRCGVDYRAVREHHVTIFEEPFSSESRRMVVGVTGRHGGEAHTVIVKGAPEALAQLVNHKEKQRLISQAAEMALMGMRVLAVGEGDSIAHIKLLGVIGEEDTIREEVQGALQKAREAHIETIMVTGDHVLAAYVVAKRMGMVQTHSQVLDASQLGSCDDSYLVKRITSGAHPLRVFARVSPADKLRLVELLKKYTSAVVAVTGDGVNDAPAIRAAHVGVAMGVAGSDVAKEAADIVIVDDNYSTIITAVRRGRVIYDNILKFIHFLLSGNMSELTVVLFAAAAGYPLFLAPIQILYINFITDGISALALAVESADANLMHHVPRDRHAPLFSSKRWIIIVIEGLVIAGLTLLGFYLALPYGEKTARTVAFLVMVCTQLLHTLNVRSYRESIFASTHKPNIMLFLSLFLSLALTIAVIEIGPLRIFMQVSVIRNVWLLLLIPLLSLGIIVFVEIRKLAQLWYK